MMCLLLGSGFDGHRQDDNQKQNADWKDFRVNICIDDTDDDGFA